MIFPWTYSYRTWATCLSLMQAQDSARLERQRALLVPYQSKDIVTVEHTFPISNGLIPQFDFMFSCSAIMINEGISKHLRFSRDAIRTHHPNRRRLQRCRQHLYLFLSWILLDLKVIILLTLPVPLSSGVNWLIGGPGRANLLLIPLRPSKNIALMAK